MNKTRSKNVQNPLFAYYNINSLRYKFDDLKEIVSKSLPDILVFAETKLDNSFTNSQFFLQDYFEPTRKDNTRHSGGIIEFVRKGIVRKRLVDFELKEFESIASEITLNKRKLFILSFYRTERTENRLTNIKKFFQELSLILNKVIEKYDDIVLMGDINIDFHDKKTTGFRELKEFMNIFGLHNLVKEKTCFFRENESSIDCILTNNQRKFFNSSSLELGVSDCHKMVSTYLRTHISRLKTKIITYRSFKSFNKEAFLNELSPHLENLSSGSINTVIKELINVITNILDKYAPIKQKKVRGNQSRFMNKNLSRAIMHRSKLRSKYLKNKNTLNRTNYKKQRNICVKLRDKAIKSDFQNSFSNLKSNSKPFYDIMKPYLTNKGALCSSDITLIENDKIITDDTEIGNIFVDYYTNIVKHSSGKEPTSIADSLPPGTNFDTIIDKICDQFQNHPSIRFIKNSTNHSHTFKFRFVTEKEILKLLKSIDSKKAIGVDGIPPLILKLSAEILAKPLTKLINQSIKENDVPTLLKIAAILPFYKKNERSHKNNYRPVSVLSALSKIFGKVLQNQILEFINDILSTYVSAYRKGYSTQHVLTRLVEDWKKGLDEDYYVGSVLMDLSKAFDCIPHDLLIAKLNAYGFEKSALKYIYSYLKGRRQCVKVNGIQSKFMTILAGVPQGSILGPLLFNIFINDFYYIFTTAKLYGFADDNSLSGKSKTLEGLKNILTSESKVAIKWLNDNQMLANPSKFQVIILTKSKEHIKTTLQIDGNLIESKESVDLLGIEIDDKMKFESHISKLCTKAGGQLNSLFRFKKYLTPVTKKLSINSFIFSNFNYCPLVWHFCSTKSKNKIEQIQKRAFKFLNLNNVLGSIQSTMEVKRLRTLAIEIYKTLNNMNPSYMKQLFNKPIYRTSRRFKGNLESKRFKQVKYGRNSLNVLAPILWNSLPTEAKQLPSLDEFKRFIQIWGNFGCPIYEKFLSYCIAIK